ncbi:hypothetical protein MMC20_002322 [Loxospora ochrophaea]|nr:hypothetical protein [Loxospora ochrophaea]
MHRRALKDNDKEESEYPCNVGHYPRPDVVLEDLARCPKDTVIEKQNGDSNKGNSLIVENESGEKQFQEPVDAAEGNFSDVETESVSQHDLNCYQEPNRNGLSRRSISRRRKEPSAYLTQAISAVQSSQPNFCLLRVARDQNRRINAKVMPEMHTMIKGNSVFPFSGYKVGA